MNTRRIILALIVAVGLFQGVSLAQSAVQRSMDEYNKGRAYLEAKNYQLAVQHFNNSILIYPSSGAYMDLGIAYHQMKKYPHSIAAFKQVIPTVPNNAEVRYWLAKSHHSHGLEITKQGTLAQALPEFVNSENEARMAIRLKPDYQAAYFILGAGLYLQKKPEEALPAFEQAVTLSPNDAESLYLLGFTYAQLGRKTPAMNVYRKLLALNKEYAEGLLKRIEQPAAANSGAVNAASASPGTAEYFLNEGNKFRDTNDYAKAIASYKRALALKPTLPNAHLNLGYCYYLLDQYQNAMPAFQQAVRLEPTDSGNHYWLGVTYHRLKQHQLALNELKEAVRLKPDDAFSHHWLGEVYAEGLKQYGKAIPEYRESVRLKPDYALAHNQLGLAYSQMEELDDALASFQQALRLKPNEPLYYSNVGMTFTSMGRKEDAFAVQRSLQKVNPTKAKELADHINSVFPPDKDEPGYLLVLADVVRYGGKYDASLPIFRRVLVLSSDPTMKAGALSGMGEAYSKKNLPIKATAAFQQAMAIYQQILRLKPSDGYAHYGLAKCYLGLGQKDMALRIQRRLTTINPKIAKDLLDEINEAK